MPTRRRQAGDGIFSEKENSLRPEHLFAGVQKQQQRPGRSPGFCIAAFTKRRSSQWRDRAGISPASLFFPLPKRDTQTHLKEPGTRCSYDWRQVITHAIGSQNMFTHRTSNQKLPNVACGNIGLEGETALRF